MFGKEKGGKQWNQDISLEEFCESTWKELYRFIYYKVQNREEAEDITQETYAKAISYLNRNNVKVINYGGYLKVIASNIMKDYWRKTHRKDGNLNIEEVDPVEFATEDFAETANDRATLEKALKSLTEEQQQVIHLRIMKGYSSAETAKIMDRKEGTVRVIQYRAIKALASILKDLDYKGGF